MSATGVSVLDDPRWTAFNRTGFACSCGDTHLGLVPINMLIPLGWSGPTEYQPDEALTLDGDFLSTHYCVSEGRSFALRVRLPLQMLGAAPAAFVYSAWATVSRADFEAYVAAKNAGTLDDTRYVIARLGNRLAGHHDTSNLMGAAFEQTDGGPPVMLLVGPQPYTNRPDHPLIAEQRDGIDLDRALELLAIFGHDMRAATLKAA